MKIVTPLPASGNYTPEQALDAAKHVGYTTVLIAGYDADGALKFRNSNITCQDALWIIENLKARILAGD